VAPLLPQRMSASALRLLPAPGDRKRSRLASHGVSNQTARTDLQKLAAQDLLLSMRQGRTEVFAVPADLTKRLPAL
jgi:hypothetical protein